MTSGEVDKLAEIINKAMAELREQDLREKTRRANLTPAQRQAEDQERARSRQAAETQRFRTRITKAVRRHRGHETLTLLEFGSLLQGIDPAENSEWSFLRPTDADATIAQLTSAIGASLLPVNSDVSAAQLRFKTADLIDWARSKRFRGVDYLADALGVEMPSGKLQSSRTHVAAPASPGSNRSEAKQQIAQRPVPVIESIKEMIAWAEREGYGPIDSEALPFRRDDLFEHYKAFCKKRGIRPYGLTQFKAVMGTARIRLKPGTDNPEDIKLLHHWRAGERTKSG